MDMHLHAKRADALGFPRFMFAPLFSIWPVKDAQEDARSYFGRAQAFNSLPGHHFLSDSQVDRNLFGELLSAYSRKA